MTLIKDKSKPSVMPEEPAGRKQARNFGFTESHDVMMGKNPNNPEVDYSLVMVFQWQNGKLRPVYPKKIMEEAGATYTYPPCSGPGDDQ